MGLGALGRLIRREAARRATEPGSLRMSTEAKSTVALRPRSRLTQRGRLDGINPSTERRTALRSMSEAATPPQQHLFAWARSGGGRDTRSAFGCKQILARVVESRTSRRLPRGRCGLEPFVAACGRAGSGEARGCACDEHLQARAFACLGGDAFGPWSPSQDQSLLPERRSTAGPSGRWSLPFAL